MIKKLNIQKKWNVKNKYVKKIEHQKEILKFNIQK